ncbi:predicted protein [Nematostella vectensis]|uniref:Uncharacterized protein n=1 Tax=Nematostella vectensis TaxID=45351 RepID=A7SJX7_NEMVE|nr:predicted protein [Nematostella vectensis]|eukprot:XP_001628037.1 predicted protein [Nematostella vectensis]
MATFTPAQDDHHHLSSNQYFVKSSQRESDMESIRKNLPNALNKLPTTPNKFRILSLGRGTGHADKNIMRVVLESSPSASIVNRGIDPSAHRIGQFKDSIVMEDDPKLKEAEFEFYNNTFEGYLANRDSAKAHLIHAVSISWIWSQHWCTVTTSYKVEFRKNFDKGMVEAVLDELRKISTEKQGRYLAKGIDHLAMIHKD